MVAPGSDYDLESSHWLDVLPSHAIFSSQPGSQGRQCMAVRGGDLIVAGGSSLRMASLLEVKHNESQQSASCSTSAATKGAERSYKILTSDVLNFDIAEILLNPSGKLLAVMGSHKVVVVVLPRPGLLSSKSVGSQIPVKATVVGSYYYHERIGGRARLAAVKWHPWGHLGSSLLIMSRDGVMRQFDVSQDVQEPSQTVSLLPSSANRSDGKSRRSLSRSRSGALSSRSRSQTPTANQSIRSTSRFALDEDDESSDEEGNTSRFGSASAQSAVTFTFGIDMRDAEEEESDVPVQQSADWKALTVYTVCSNGDIFALCPFLPANVSIPLSFLHSFSSLTSQQSSDASSSPRRLNRDLQGRYVASIIKQATRLQRERDPISPLRSRRSVSATPMSLDEKSSVPSEEAPPQHASGETVYVQAPSTTIIPQPPRPQGPFLLWPAPIELSEERENVASDLCFSRLTGPDTCLDVLSIVGDDGRIDICLLLEEIEPQWMDEGRSLRSKGNRKISSSSGRYALSDSDSEDWNDESVNDSGSVKPLPSLFVYETIDLGFSAHVSLQVSRGSGRLPSFVPDPLYTDTFYVQHATGAHVVSLSTWSRDLLTAMAMPEDQRLLAMERALHAGAASAVVQAVDASGRSDDSKSGLIGLCIISDVYLSYSLLALARSGALVASELCLRVEDESRSTFGRRTEPKGLDIASRAEGPLPYASLLDDGAAFLVPEPFKQINGLPYHPRAAIKGNHSSAEIRVTTESLRALATVVSLLRGEMRKLVKGGKITHSRLELQKKELDRQLAKLNEVKKRIDENRKKREQLDDRVDKVLIKQASLGKRSDRLLQKLIENHSPELSLYEGRWLKELDRLKDEVGQESTAKGSEEASGLHARVAKLQYQFEALRPDLVRLKERGSEKGSTELMGAKQLEAVESILAKEAHLLALDRDKVADLQARMQRNTLH